MISWRAIYKDGSTLPQYNEDGTENRYEDINREKLDRFEFIKDDRLIFVLFLKKGQQLIYRARRFIRMRKALKYPLADIASKVGVSIEEAEKIPVNKLEEMAGEKLIVLDTDTAERHTVYIIGWRMKVGKRNIMSIAYIYEDGHIELDDSRNDLMLRKNELFREELEPQSARNRK